MTVLVSDTLRDSGGNPAPNATIKLYTKTGTGGILPSATYQHTTDDNGLYSFNIGIGEHILSVQYDRTLHKVGSIIVNSDTASPTTLDILLNSSEPLLPDEIALVQQLLSEANEAAAEAESSASGAAQSASDAEAAAQTAADDAVSAVQSQLDDEVQAAANSASESAQSASDAEMWATGGTGGTASATNNAKYYSELAEQTASRALAWGGYFTPTASAEYPTNMDGLDTQYIIKISDTDIDATYTYTTGDLAGTTVMNGYTLIYDYTNETTDEWVAIPYNLGGVLTIDDEEPDDLGNISGIARVGDSYTKVEADGLLDDKADQADVSYLLGIDDGEVGSVIFKASQNTPQGYLKCVGTEISRTTYSRLFSEIGTLYGTGDGSTTFNIPDVRGYFPRFWDDSAGIDSGRSLGSTQDDAIRNITGQFSLRRLSSEASALDSALRFSDAFQKNGYDGDTGLNSGSVSGSSAEGTYIKFDASRQVPTASENRPKNIALSAYIKY